MKIHLQYKMLTRRYSSHKKVMLELPLVIFLSHNI